MDPADQSKLIDHLNAGKPLYIEGADLGFSIGNSNFYKMLGTDFQGDGYQYEIGSLSGLNGTIVDGKNYDFLKVLEEMGQMVDEIGAGDGTLIFKCNNGKGRAVCYEEPQKKYRVIHSSFVFGGIKGIDEKNELMKIYLDYLLPSTPVIGGIVMPGGTTTSNVLVMPRIQNNQLRYTLKSPTQLRVDLFTISGRLMLNIVNEKLDRGTYYIDLRPSSNTGSGMYIIRFNANGTVINKKVKIAQ